MIEMKVKNMSMNEFGNSEISVNSSENGNNVINGCFNQQSSLAPPSSQPLLEVTNVNIVQNKLNSSNPIDHSVLPSLHELLSTEQQNRNTQSQEHSPEQQSINQSNLLSNYHHSLSQPQSPNPNLTNYHSNQLHHQQHQQQHPTSYQHQIDKHYHSSDLHHQHHQQHSQTRHHSQNRINQIGFSPSTLPGSSSDRAHSPPAIWSQSHQRSHHHHLHHNDPNQLRHRSISLSTPTSSHSSNTLDHAPSHSMGRILPLPYGLASPDLPHIESQSALHITSLPELDHRYHHHLTGSTSRRYSQKLMSNSYDTYSPYEYPTSILSHHLPQTAFDFNSRLPTSPSHNLYRSVPHRTYDHHLNHPIDPSHSSGSGIGQKRKLLHSPLDHAAPSPPFKRLNTHQSAPKVIPIPQAKDAGHQRMTTILCLHASVAQKSYGQEKRFLCPPPLVRIIGPYRQLPKYNRPILSMSILNEEGERHLSQTAYLGEEDSNVHFKSLHISGAAKKAKHVTLELSLHSPSHLPHHNIHGTGPDVNELALPFATFTSNECNIISKPSKKTAKARNTQSCIFNGSTICLFNRINSQTVRTKYLCVEQDQLAARASQWSAFTINVVRRAEDAGLDGSPPLAAKTLLSSSIPGADRTVTYGSEVELIDFVTGVSSGPLIVRKVEKNKVQKDATGPISQMQKLAFCKVDRNDGSAIYVSALEPGRFPSPSELGSPFEMTGGNESNGMTYGQPCQPTQLPSLHSLQYQAPRATLPPEERGGMTLDEIDDSVAWTVIGVAHFSHTFFDLSQNYPQIPHEPITPLPVIISRPEIELEAMSLTMSLTGFFDAEARPMEIWMGPIGPLPVNVIGTTGITLASEHATSGGGGVRLQMNERSRQETILVVSLPGIEMMYWTLHSKEMRSGTMIVLDESNKSIGELIGKRADSVESAIPTLPITVIRPDGMSFVMSYSICLVENELANHSNPHQPTPPGFRSDGTNGNGNGNGEDDVPTGPVCILKVI